jgi:alpha-glucoside transport system permease protein
VFIGINKLFDQAEPRFPWFNAGVGGISSLAVFGLLWGNRLLVSPAVVTLVAVVVGAVTGFALGVLTSRGLRLLSGLTGGTALGLLAGWALVKSAWPMVDYTAAVVGLAVGGGIGLLHWLLTGRRLALLSIQFFWLSVGWLFGAWGAAGPGGGIADLFLASGVLGALAGAWVGTVPYPDDVKRTAIASGSRKYIFTVPALLFIVGTLVVPLGRTIWLGFLTGSPRNLEWTGLTNYGTIFTDPGIIDFSGWTEMFSSRIFWAAIVFMVLGLALGRWLGRSGGTGLGTGFSVSAGTLMLIGGGMVLLGFAVFLSIRGTIPNNLWWIFAVTLFSAAMGLAVAVLADRSKGENVAKAMIFLPMSISFVGASIIWRFMYIARPPQDDQTGVINTVWVQLGEWSQSATTSALISLILALVIAGLLYLAWRGWQADSNALVAGSLVLTLPLVWVIYRFLGPGLGGFIINPLTGEAIGAPILFLTQTPWNNWWMMVVFIWIQTGFAMVIFSAAIKSVPEELLEAARIDGATESQTFWRVTVPQIYPTLGVVTTTLIVTVLKVFDIPKVMTNGNFDTQVLANEMWQKAFTELDFGVGSAVAVILFLGVLPVMYLNIRRMQKERLA